MTLFVSHTCIPFHLNIIQPCLPGILATIFCLMCHFWQILKWPHLTVLASFLATSSHIKVHSGPPGTQYVVGPLDLSYSDIWWRYMGSGQHTKFNWNCYCNADHFLSSNTTTHRNTCQKLLPSLNDEVTFHIVLYLRNGISKYSLVTNFNIKYSESFWVRITVQ